MSHKKLASLELRAQPPMPLDMSRESIEICLDVQHKQLPEDAPQESRSAQTDLEPNGQKLPAQQQQQQHTMGLNPLSQLPLPGGRAGYECVLIIPYCLGWTAVQPFKLCCCPKSDFCKEPLCPK